MTYATTGDRPGRRELSERSQTWSILSDSIYKRYLEGANSQKKAVEQRLSQRSSRTLLMFNTYMVYVGDNKRTLATQQTPSLIYTEIHPKMANGCLKLWRA